MRANFARWPHGPSLAAAGAAVSIATLVCFWRVIDFEFVNYDDNKYILMNAVVRNGLTIDGLRWAFRTFTLANWHPLTWLSHMLDVQMFGLNAGMHHVVNVLIHAANAALLLVLLARMTGDVWRSALVAALFAIHPLHVESVAWISERKDVLSTFFGLLAMIAYVRWTSTKTGTGPIFLTILGCFALSLMCKPMLVTLPFVLLLLDIWPLRRLRTWGLIIEKLPLFALSAASSIISVIAQDKGGAISSLEAISIESRLSNAVVSYAMYLWQMIWPSNLSPLYPLPASWPPLTITLSAAILLAITILACRFASRRPYFIVGWLWYLGTLVPVIGLIQVGTQARADRYTYVPLIGVFIMIAWSIPSIPREHRAAIAIRTILVVAVLLACGAATWRQLGYWSNSIALSERALAVTSHNAVAHFNLANALVTEGRHEDAISHFITAAQLQPAWADIDNNLGNAYVRLGRETEALAAYRSALSKDAHHPNALKSLGVVVAQQGDLQEAVRLLALSAEVNPNDPVTHMFLGTALRDLNHRDEALNHLARAAELARAIGDDRLLADIARRAAEMPPPPR
jgi:Flp pilus assembly protein TadD